MPPVAPARFTVRRMMVAVAVAVGVPAALHRKAQRYRRLADYHAARVGLFESGPPGREHFYDAVGRPVGAGRSRWRAELAVRYRRAASRPWRPLAPDPPEPE
jgi:hypothetical protein